METMDFTAAIMNMLMGMIFITARNANITTSPIVQILIFGSGRLLSKSSPMPNFLCFLCLLWLFCSAFTFEGQFSR